MLTIFSTPKPFIGHINIIQRNAIKSWTLLHPDVEIILFGDEEGAAETAREFYLQHVPEVAANQFGTKLLRGLFEPAQKIARHQILCYVNCDVMLPSSFATALQLTLNSFERFLMVGQRCDTDITDPWDFADRDWESRLCAFSEHGKLAPTSAVDYFAFPRGLHQDMPPLVIGRIWWDHWLVWKARSLKVPVVDASATVMAVHQKHDYSYHPKARAGVWCDEQANQNYELSGGKWHLYTIDDSTHTLTSRGVIRNWKSALVPYWRASRPAVIPLWFKFLDTTRPLRNRLAPCAGIVPSRPSSS